jgi:hypothetical protein
MHSVPKSLHRSKQARMRGQRSKAQQRTVETPLWHRVEVYFRLGCNAEIPNNYLSHPRLNCLLWSGGLATN